MSSVFLGGPQKAQKAQRCLPGSFLCLEWPAPWLRLAALCVKSHTLWHDWARTINQLIRDADHEFRTMIVFLAHVLEQFSSRGPLHREASVPGRCVCAWIIDRDLI